MGNNHLTLLREHTEQHCLVLKFTVMASLLSTTATTLQHTHRFCFCPSKPTTPYNISFLTNRFNSGSIKCSAFFDNMTKELLLDNNTFYVDQFQRVSEDLSDMQKLGVLLFAGVTWFYLTARPGILVGAIDAFLLAPMQLVLDSLSGRRNLKGSDFLIGNKLGEGSFGVVYSGVLVRKNVDVEERRMQKNGRGKVMTKLDAKPKDKVILKKVKVGIEGAEEFGDYEEWFNYRLSRAAPETCAKFIGSFVANKSNSIFTKGGKWLVWKFEGDRSLADYMADRSFPSNLESVMFGSVLQGVDISKRNALIIKQIMRQIITSLKKIHNTGIVHRDVKPANLVVTKRGQIKLIDFGAATDLRIGKNYFPNYTPLDPDYSPPELYVLPQDTQSLPPEPIAALLSPILWQNFVGLSVADGYIACGSETNEVYTYYRSLPMPITSHKFGSIDPISGKETDDDHGQFVSSVCWRGKSDMLIAANSSGCIKVLQMV